MLAAFAVLRVMVPESLGSIGPPEGVRDRFGDPRDSHGEKHFDHRLEPKLPITNVSSKSKIFALLYDCEQCQCTTVTLMKPTLA